MAEKNHITNRSNDEGYFVITPRIVLYMCESPYEYTLWSVIRDIAGDKKECFLTTEQLATLAMMSVGKASQCRKSLIRKGLLEGIIKKDPGYPQPVWHLTIPDLWPRNNRWCQDKTSIFNRLSWRKQQQEASMDDQEFSPGEAIPGEPSPHEAFSEEPSCSEKGHSPHEAFLTEPSCGEKGPSPHEEGPSPHEKGPSPHEAKNIQKSIKKESKEDSAEIQRIWGAIRLQLKAQCTPRVFREYVQDAEPVSWDGEVLNIKAQDYKAAWLSSRLSSTINNLLKPSVNNPNAVVQFLPAPSLPPYRMSQSEGNSV